MPSWLEGKRVLVTGGAGAFGQKFLPAAREARCSGVVVFSRDEMKHAALKRELGALAKEVEFRIGDVTDPESVALAMRRIDLVIHAAAMKHLPECEANVVASNRVNVLGTQVVANAFLRSEARALVLLSTDKAPYASSAYGAQKYLAEKIVWETARLAGPDQRAFSLRYSNVMDSTGSVFHVFRQTLQADRTATVNGAQTSRGFVTQTQVLEALRAALAAAGGGETLVLRPKVVRVADLAEAMRKLLGHGRVEVVRNTGFVGEKESATLITAEERPVAREFGELSSGAVLLDLLARHPGRPAASLPDRGLTLDDCEPLSGSELESFVAALL